MFLAAIFDMDGLLIDSERTIMQAWLDAARESGVPLRANDFTPVIGKTHDESEAILTSLLGSPDTFGRTAARVAALLSANAPGPRFPLKAGAHELLSSLCAARVPCAVASSSRVAEITHRLSSVGVLDFFSVVAGGDEVFRGKPDPGVYQLVAKRLGVPPTSCLAFEDSENGVAAAMAAGIQVVVVPDLNPPSAALAKRSFQVLGSLHEAIESIPQWFVGSERA